MVAGMSEPQVIIGGEPGFNHKSLKKAADRIKEGKGYRDLSTVCVVPTRGVIDAVVVERWMGLMTPMNQRFVRIFIRGMEVGDAYNKAVEIILGNPGLADFKYMLTLEEDNTPPPDGLLKLYESIDEYAIVAGLYFTKGEGGQPMIYGDPKAMFGFQPQIPRPNEIQECNGTGMGFTLFDIDLFRDPKIEKPWFKTVQAWDPVTGGEAGTQDLHFMSKVRKAGYKIASDNRVRVGHVDTADGGRIW
jgi:hypothetical protein